MDSEGADLGGADSEGADLGGADSEGADLGGADSEEADLGGTDSDLGRADSGGGLFPLEVNVCIVRMHCFKWSSFVREDR